MAEHGGSWRPRRARPRRLRWRRAGRAPWKPPSGIIWRRCSVERLDALGAALDAFSTGRARADRRWRAPAAADADDARRESRRPARPSCSSSARILTADDTRRGARAAQPACARLVSIMTRRGEWVGRDWLRIARGADAHTGVIEREHRLKGLRAPVCGRERSRPRHRGAPAAVRQSLAESEAERNAAQSKIQGAHRSHADLLGQLEATRARAQEASLRRARHRRGGSAVSPMNSRLRSAALARAGAGACGAARLRLRHLMHSSRRCRPSATRAARRLPRARSAAQAAQLAARDLLVRSESVRTAENSLALGPESHDGAARAACGALRASLSANLQAAMHRSWSSKGASPRRSRNALRSKRSSRARARRSRAAEARAARAR